VQPENARCVPLDARQRALTVRSNPPVHVYPTQHAALTALTALPFRAAGVSWRSLALFGAGAVLIDVDHYLSYAWHQGDFSLANAYRFHRNRVDRHVARPGFNLHLPPLWPGPNRPLHAVSALTVLCALAWAAPALRPVVAGALYHRLQDYLYESTSVGVQRAE
jgi:hypothetical protein